MNADKRLSREAPATLFKYRSANEEFARSLRTRARSPGLQPCERAGRKAAKKRPGILLPVSRSASLIFMAAFVATSREAIVVVAINGLRRLWRNSFVLDIHTHAHTYIHSEENG